MLDSAVAGVEIDAGMATRRRWWRVQGRLNGWAVTRQVRNRPSAASPHGYWKPVDAPGTPFRDRASAEAEARRLNGQPTTQAPAPVAGDVAPIRPGGDCGG